MTPLVITQTLAAATFAVAVLSVVFYLNGTVGPRVVWGAYAVWIAVMITWGVLCDITSCPLGPLFLG